MTTAATAEEVADVLSRARFTASSEARLQDGIAVMLEREFPGQFIREHRLSGRDRPDFFGAGIAIETKWGTSGGSLLSVVRQLSRYAEHEAVKSIIFCSPSRRVASGIPEQIGGVPVTRVALHTGI